MLRRERVLPPKHRTTIRRMAVLSLGSVLVLSVLAGASAAAQINGNGMRCTGLASCSFSLTDGNGGTGTASTYAGVGGYVGQSPLNFAGGTVYFRLPGEASVTVASGVYSGQAVLSGSSSTAGTLYHITGTFSATDVNTGKVVTGSTDTVVGIKGHSGRGGGITFTLVTGQI